MSRARLVFLPHARRHTMPSQEPGKICHLADALAPMRRILFSKTEERMRQVDDRKAVTSATVQGRRLCAVYQHTDHGWLTLPLLRGLSRRGARQGAPPDAEPAQYPTHVFASRASLGYGERDASPSFSRNQRDPLIRDAYDQLHTTAKPVAGKLSGRRYRGRPALTGLLTGLCVVFGHLYRILFMCHEARECRC